MASDSPKTQLIEYTEGMLRGMKDRKQSDVVVMDFDQAFDTVSHTRLLHKLHMHVWNRPRDMRMVQVLSLP